MKIYTTHKRRDFIVITGYLYILYRRETSFTHSPLTLTHKTRTISACLPNSTPLLRHDFCLYMHANTRDSPNINLCSAQKWSTQITRYFTTMEHFESIVWVSDFERKVYKKREKKNLVNVIKTPLLDTYSTIYIYGVVYYDIRTQNTLLSIKL